LRHDSSHLPPFFDREKGDKGIWRSGKSLLGLTIAYVKLWQAGSLRTMPYAAISKTKKQALKIQYQANLISPVSPVTKDPSSLFPIPNTAIFDHKFVDLVAIHPS